MDFQDQVKLLGEKTSKIKDQLQTEEATKNALVMPFIQYLGYDVFNPLEVVPEFVADIGIKKGEKVDYAIIKDGQAAILIECKHWRENLDPHSTQLFRYFHTSKARFAILTNGIEYRFYSDLVEPNKMDEKPFLEFSMLNIRDTTIQELKKFHKSYFDIEQIINSASELKYLNEIKALMNNEFREPSEGFVRYLLAQTYPGRATEKVVNQFSGIVKRALGQMLSEMINDRLQSALAKESEKEIQEETVEEVAKASEDEKKKVIETTEEEKEAFFIVRSILRPHVSSERITSRDTQSYFGVLLDDNNRKPICRFHFNYQNKRSISIFDENKNESKYDLSSLDDIYSHSDKLIKVVKAYLE